MKISGRALLMLPVLLGLAAGRAPAGDFAQKLISDPGAFWGVWGTAKANYIAAPDLKGGAAQRVSVIKAGKPWDAGTWACNNKPVKKGDVLVLMFRARAEKTPEGSDLIMVTGSIYAVGEIGISPEATFVIGKQWKLYTVSGTADRDYAPGAVNVGMKLGTGDQVINFGPVALLDFGPGFDPNSLPRE